jgi:branched-chain amino acid transport system permease protein
VLKAHLDNWKLVEGLIIIGIVILLPNGVRQIWSMVFGASPQRAAEIKPAAAEARHA